jgi:uridine kinase
MSAHIIGVAGPSSSGKSELARQLAERLPGTAIVSLDSYYRGMEEIPLEERKKVNFDHPDSLDWELLHEHLVAIAAGRAFDEPVYSFADYARTAETRRIAPTEFLIVEGLFVLYWPELRKMLNTKVYVQTWRSGDELRKASASSTSAPCVRARNGSCIPPKNTPTWW